MKLTSKLILLITIVILITQLLFGWVNHNVDSTLYHAFAEYIRTGVYRNYFVYPYKHPWTIEPPLYSLLLAGLYSLPRSDIALHSLQLLMLSASGFLVYKILTDSINKNPAVIIACLFVLIPGNLVFASYVMTETGTQLFVMLSTYWLYKYIKSQNPKYLSVTAGLGIFTSLWKFQHILYGIISLLFLMLISRKIRLYLFPLLGISAVAFWIVINHTITGVWGLSNSANVRYNLMANQAGILPPDNDPAVAAIRQYIPENVSLDQPFWEFEKYINPATGNDFSVVDKLAGNLGKAAIMTHPREFLKIGISNYFKIHNLHPPYMSNLIDIHQPARTTPDPIVYGDFYTLSFIDPVIYTPYTWIVWKRLIAASNWFYENIFGFWSLWTVFPLSVYLLISGKTWQRLIVFLFLAGKLPYAFLSTPQSRYVLPFYGQMVLITVFAFNNIVKSFKKVKTIYNEETA